MFSSLRFRLWLTYALVVGVVITIAGSAIVFYLLRNPTEARRELQRLQLVSRFILQRGQAINIWPQGVPGPRLQESLERADNSLDVRVAVFNSSGELLADSRLGRATSLPDWSYFARRGAWALPTYKDGNDVTWLYVYSRMENGNYLLVTAPRPRTPVLGILRNEFVNPFVRGAALALFLALLMAVWISHWVSAPLKRMADAARSASAGEFSKIPLEGPREVQAVAKSFNEMVEHVQASRQSQRDFIANVSHDLKTPLTSIQGFAQAILDGTVDNPVALQQAAEVIYTEAGRMHYMVVDLLELARLDSGIAGLERNPINLAELLSRVVEKFTPQARQAQINLRAAKEIPTSNQLQDSISPSGLPTIIGDADRLAQVFSNLVDNALKYTPTGGQVTLSARRVNGWVEVRVADTGPGISPSELERIFERFYQTDKSRRGGSRRGVGLGLAIAREVILAHGGTISAHNISDEVDLGEIGAADESCISAHGSVFVVKLPIALPDDSTIVRHKK